MLTIERCQEVADEVKGVCDDLKAAYYRAKQLLATNSNLAIDWGADNLPAYLGEDVDGNVPGKKYTRQQVSNAIGSIDTVVTTLEADHLGNLNKVATVAPQ